MSKCGANSVCTSMPRYDNCMCQSGCVKKTVRQCTQWWCSSDTSCTFVKSDALKSYRCYKVLSLSSDLVVDALRSVHKILITYPKISTLYDGVQGMLLFMCANLTHLYQHWRFQSCQVTHAGELLWVSVSNNHNWPEFYPGNAQAFPGLEPPMSIRTQ